MRLYFLGLLFLFINLSTQHAGENLRRVATWNMKWLGTNSGNQLDAVENVPDYARYIIKTKATLFALQEIGPTHTIAGKPRCFYLDLIIAELNRHSSGDWSYIIDKVNKQQRLAFLYNSSDWKVSADSSINPGNSFSSIRNPFMVKVKALGENAKLEFSYINIHLKAFPDATEKRRENFRQISEWLKRATIDDDVLISGDTNMYEGESDVDDALERINYKPLYDREPTSIHEDKLSQRFDRFFSSPDLMNEIISAKTILGETGYIDVIKENDDEFLKWYDDNISDHFPVVLYLDVSEER